MEILLSNNKVLTCSDEPAHDGGEGQIYLTEDRKSVVKLYYKYSIDRRCALDTIIGRLNAVSESNRYWRDYLCWPEAIVIAPRLGVVMPKVSDELRTLDWFLRSKARATLSVTDRGSWDNHILIAMRVARAVRRLHHSGLCHSDLSPNNCLVDARNGKACLIDMDGLVVPGMLPPAVEGTDGYMAPEILDARAQPSIYTDLHSLAVLIYQTLLFRHPLKGPKYHDADPALDDQLAYGREALYIEHPRDVSNRPRGPFVSSKALGSRMARMMEQVFVAGLHDRSVRPSAAQWEESLSRLYDCILPCTNSACGMKFFILAEGQPQGQPPRCPWCGQAWSALPSLPIIDLFRAVSGQRGSWSPEHYPIVGYPGRQIFEWHAFSGRSPGPEANPNPIATFEYDRRRGEWLLRNQSPECFTALNPNQPNLEVKPNQDVVLTDELRLLFGAGSDARLALVRMLSIPSASRN